MKKIAVFFLMAIAIGSYGQKPNSEKYLSGRFDVDLQIPRYTSLPATGKPGAIIQVTAGADSGFWHRLNGIWRRALGENFANTDLIASGNRYHNFNYHLLNIDFVKGFDVTSYDTIYYPGQDSYLFNYPVAIGFEQHYQDPGFGNILSTVRADYGELKLAETRQDTTAMFYMGNTLTFNFSKYISSDTLPVKIFAIVDSISSAYNIAIFQNDTLKKASFVGLPVGKSGTPSGSADGAGHDGEIWVDASFIYIKTGGVWRRSALSSF